MINIKKTKPLILIILDGWGVAKAGRANAITQANTPVIDGLLKKYPNIKLHAHGKYVGLPKGQVGNSEAGHMNIGAGRIIEQDSVKISKSIQDKTFFKNPAFTGAVRHVKKMNSSLHLMGLLSNGQSPHSDPNHLLALLKLCRKEKVKRIFLHLFTDGRDSPKYSSLKLIDDLEKRLYGNEKIASVMGRFYPMDRKKEWKRTYLAFNVFIKGKGRKAISAKDAVMESYNKGESDEYVEPYIIDKEGIIKDRDSVIFFNLRSDRTRQLAKVFVQDDFNKKNRGAFRRGKKLKHVYFVGMTDFGPDLNDIITAYPSIDLEGTLPMALSDLKQCYIAETEKYAHITYFFNGGYSGKVAGEDQILINSPKVKSYDKVPGMSSEKLTNKVIKNLKEKKYDFTLLNLAAPDMIGHTGDLEAGIECCEIVDKCVGKIVEKYLGVDGTIVITADHGNIEQMINLKTGEIFTEHTRNRVPFIIVQDNKSVLSLKNNGVLSNIAPTIIKLLNKTQPAEMKSSSLLL
ncbi:2,3-bisphosphoglycerate-independent phosphoglycerate mutase [Candidatus Parcubacteria bacterium]|nr:2,3-bisphosphoglycerate-independent phosphoglycerate mutase [Candidatus Parcubacteria bacterium]